MKNYSIEIQLFVGGGHNFLSFFLGQYLGKMYLCTRIRTTDSRIRIGFRNNLDSTDSPIRIGFRNNLDFVIVFNVNRNDVVSFRFFYSSSS